MTIKDLKGKIVIINHVSDHESAEYQRILTLAKEKDFTLLTTDEARELNLNVPDGILIAITDAESIIPIRPIDLDMETNPIDHSYEFDPTSVKRGKGKTP